MTYVKKDNGIYYIRVKILVNGKSKEKKFTGYFPTEGSVKAKENELKMLLLKEKEEILNGSKKILWKDAIKMYLEKSQYELRPSTLYNRLTALNAHTSIFNDIEVSTISKSMFLDHIQGLSLSNQTKKEVIKYSRQVFNFLADERKINLNPLAHVRLYFDKNDAFRAKSLQAMTQAEIQQVLNYCKSKDFNLYSIFFVTYQLGLRFSEAVALEFSDIVWDKNHVVVSKSWDKRLQTFAPPKNGLSRIVPLNSSLRTFLLESSDKVFNQGFVLPRHPVWLRGGAAKLLNLIQIELGIKQTNYHSLRASFITHLLRSGRSIVEVQAIVGHSDLKTTQRYIRLDGTDLIGATDSLSEIY